MAADSGWTVISVDANFFITTVSMIPNSCQAVFPLNAGPSLEGSVEVSTFSIFWSDWRRVSD